MKKHPPIVCPPIYEYCDSYVPREVPIVQPIVRVNRKVIVNVPKYYVQPTTREEVIDPGHLVNPYATRA